VIDSQNILYPVGSNDECYTPEYGVLPILEYIPSGAVVWCPFDTHESNFVKLISQTNEVKASHISQGLDFYKYEPNRWDVMVSNPPFTNKRQIFERALSFQKPMALLMSNTWLNDKYSKWVFFEAGRTMELLMFDRRIKFLNNGKQENKITFSSSYFCSDFLPRQIVIKPLNEPS
jgi:hypothetical protein